MTTAAGLLSVLLFHLLLSANLISKIDPDSAYSRRWPPWLRPRKLGKVSVDTFNPKVNFFFSILMTLAGLTGISSSSLSSYRWPMKAHRSGTVIAWFHAWSTAGYEYLLYAKLRPSMPLWLQFVNVVGTLINVTVTSTYAYALSRPISSSAASSFHHLVTML